MANWRSIHHAPVSQIHNAIWALPLMSLEHGKEDMLLIQPDYTIRPYRFIVDPICAPFYFITEMMFGHQIMIDNPISAVCFPPLPPDFNKLSEEDRAIIQSYLNKITFPTITPANRVRITVRHRGMCPFHSDCNRIEGMAKECKGPPFSAYFQGISQY